MLRIGTSTVPINAHIPAEVIRLTPLSFSPALLSACAEAGVSSQMIAQPTPIPITIFCSKSTADVNASMLKSPYTSYNSNTSFKFITFDGFKTLEISKVFFLS